VGEQHLPQNGVSVLNPKKICSPFFPGFGRGAFGECSRGNPKDHWDYSDV